MERLIRQIAVRNERGVELTLYEFVNYRPLRTRRGVIQRAGRKRFALQTGELVNLVDDNHFVLTSTGEALFLAR